MYYCKNCNLAFDHPVHYSEDRTPGGAFGEMIQHFDGCPSCGGGYEEAIECPRCEDEYIPVSSQYPFCEKCQKDIIKTLLDTFREDEYDFIYEFIECKSYQDLEKEVK